MSQVLQLMIRCARLFRVRPEKRIDFDNHGTGTFLVRLTLQWLPVAGLMAGCMTANASTLVGEWTGSATNVIPTYDGPQVLDVFFLTQTPDGAVFDLTGTAAITCVDSSDTDCGTGGTSIPFTGSLAANDSLSFATEGGPAGTLDLSVDQNSLTGTVTAPGPFSADWALSRVDPVPVPAALPLLLSGLGGLGALVRRRKLSA